MAIIFARGVIILLVLVIVMRLMGKRQIGEMQPYEFVITLLIAEVACVPMSDVSIPLLYGIVSVVSLFILHQIMSFIEQRGEKWRNFLSGKPSSVITPDGINFSELTKNNMDAGDLIETLRAIGYFSIEEIKYAILESNGKISVINNPDKQKSSELSVILIENGKIVKDNAKLCGFTKEKLSKILSDHKTTPNKVGLMTIDGQGKVFLQNKKEKYTVFNTKIEEKLQW